MAKILTDGANMYDDKKYMKRALALAAAAARDGEAPVGCVIVSDGQIVASGRNMREKKKNALLHAEIIAINRALSPVGTLETQRLYRIRDAGAVPDVCGRADKLPRRPCSLRLFRSQGRLIRKHCKPE